MGQVVLDPEDPVRRERARAPTVRKPRTANSNLTRSAWSLIDQLAVSGGGFIGVVAMARNLPPEDYGVFSLLFGAMLALQLANATLIFHPLSVRLPVAPAGRRRRLISDSAMLAVLLAAILCAPLAIGLWALGYGDLAAPSVACFLAWQAQEAMRRGFFCSFRIPEAVPGDILRYGGQGAGIIALAWFGELTLARALWVIAVSASLAVLLQGWQLQVTVCRSARVRATARDFWSIGGYWTLGAGLLSHFRLHLLPIALALFHGPVAAAGFQAALNVINLLNPVTISLGNIIPQAVSEGRKTSMRAAWGAARSYLLLGLAPIVVYGLLTLAIPTFVLTIFYGADSPYVELTAPLQLLMGGIMLAYASEVFDSFLHGIVEVRIAFYIMALGTFVVAIATFPLVYAFGLVGGCIAFILANLARLVASLIAQRRIMARSTSGTVSADAPGAA